jgi:hypothetical protein
MPPLIPFDTLPALVVFDELDLLLAHLGPLPALVVFDELDLMLAHFGLQQ